MECPDHPEFDHPAMMVHMREIHSIEPSTSQGTRQLVLCLDGTGFYHHAYDIVIDGLNFKEFRQAERAKKKSTEGALQ